MMVDVKGGRSRRIFVGIAFGVDPVAIKVEHLNGMIAGAGISKRRHAHTAKQQHQYHNKGCPSFPHRRADITALCRKQDGSPGRLGNGWVLRGYFKTPPQLYRSVQLRGARVLQQQL